MRRDFRFDLPNFILDENHTEYSAIISDDDS